MKRKNSLMENIQKVKVSSRKLNIVNINIHNTHKHERLKFEIYWFLRKERGFDIITECCFSNNKRADIFIPFLDLVIEILESEKPQDCIDKVKNYPISKTILLETKKGIAFNLRYLEKVI